jgi:hypothetical protein
VNEKREMKSLKEKGEYSSRLKEGTYVVYREKDVKEAVLKFKDKFSKLEKEGYNLIGFEDIKTEIKEIFGNFEK